MCQARNLDPRANGPAGRVFYWLDKLTASGLGTSKIHVHQGQVAMSEDQPQIYLVTPQSFELGGFSNDLSRLLDSFEIACVRLRAGEDDAAELGRRADALREICHARDVPLVIETHVSLAVSHGLDGVHLTNGARQVRDARKELASDAIVGAFCEDSRHTGMTAGEAGADYVTFGPVAPGTLATTPVVAREVFEFWSEAIELPVVAEGGITPDVAADLASVVDFLALGAEIWSHGAGPDAALRAILDRF